MSDDKQRKKEWLDSYESRLRRQGVPAHVAEESARRAFDQEYRRGLSQHGTKARPQGG